MVRTELLAPAKDKEIAKAAIDCGADAIYIGASAYGARQNARNSIDDIKDVVQYAHKFWAKVFVTVNTILTDEELDAAVELVKELDEIGVDAVLVQDMGLLARLIELKLSLPIHASTQCDNRTLEKVSFFEKVGLSRVVLARELSLEQIKRIHEKNPKLELEAFVHGALCVSYSGQCYLSQYIGGRSANRGECAQPCRKQYRVFDTEGKEYDYSYALCLKDLNASNCIKDMIDSGVFSFKIEGRLKDVEYVKNVTSYYRQLLDKYSQKSSSGKITYPFVPDVDRTFNRGFTEYFLKGRMDCFNQISPKSRGKYIGQVKHTNADKKQDNSIFVETDHELHNGDGLCYKANGKLEGFLVNKAVKSDNGYIIYPNSIIKLKNGTKLYRNLDVQFEKELQKTVKRQIGLNVNVRNRIITLSDEDGITESAEIKLTEKARNQEKMNDTFIKQFSKTGESDFYIIDIKLDDDIPFMPVSEINNIRREAFSKLMQKRLNMYKRQVQKPMEYTPFYLQELDYRANVHNKDAEEFYKKCGSSVQEYSMETKVPQRQIELMRTKHCIKYALNMCKSPDSLFLQDEKNVIYPLKFDCKNCEMVVLSPN